MMLTVLLALLAQPSGAAAPAEPAAARSDLEVAVAFAPTPFRGDGRTHLAYELRVTNRGAGALVLRRLEVLDQVSGPVLVRSFADAELRALVGPTGAAGPVRLEPRATTILHVWLSFESDAPVPLMLKHRATCRSPGVDLDLPQIAGELVEVRRRPPISLGPPLRGGPWLAANGPSNSSGHRRTQITIVSPRVPQRYAIDWGKLDREGKRHRGNAAKNESYYCHGQEVLAVASARVVSVKDGIPENAPGLTSRAVTINLDNAAGNHVILDLGDDQFALYAHLQPGSLRVAVGDEVERGQVLGLVGNSGNSTEPHLHFHVGDAASPLACEGLPYVLDEFEWLGSGVPDGPLSVEQPHMRKGELPMQNALVRFVED